MAGEKRQRRIDTNSLGAVPLGIPLIVGPAVLATSLLLANDFGKMMTSLALIGNIVLAGGLFFFARPITKILGITGSKVCQKFPACFWLL
ncbi:MAG: hypothetical protein JRE63_13465 [Deltaproteobacteria bacterium]|nr:hypothetical protein [Deltaproteobacteria bacterium]